MHCTHTSKWIPSVCMHGCACVSVCVSVCVHAQVFEVCRVKQFKYNTSFVSHHTQHLINHSTTKGIIFTQRAYSILHTPVRWGTNISYKRWPRSQKCKLYSFIVVCATLISGSSYKIPLSSCEFILQLCLHILIRLLMCIYKPHK
jgi:hypothetical protein